MPVKYAYVKLFNKTEMMKSMLILQCFPCIFIYPTKEANGYRITEEDFNNIKK